MTIRARLVMAALAVVAATGCTVAAAPAAPATYTTQPPPWPAPRDAISYIEATGLRQVHLDATDHQHILDVTISIDGEPVPLAPFIGIDRVRAVQAPIHTHDDSGEVWLEGEGTSEVELRHLFELWGVRATDDCLGAACGRLDVRVDGEPLADPWPVRLVDVKTVDIAVVTG